jgi:hypothetical protein
MAIAAHHTAPFLLVQYSIEKGNCKLFVQGLRSFFESGKLHISVDFFE